MIAPIFTATVTKGMVVFYNVELFNNYLAPLEGKDVSVSVKPKKKVRSNNQNSYMWGVVYQLISETTGYTPQEVHDAMRMMFLLDRTRDVPTLRSTTSLSTVEMEEYLENIRQWAASHLSCSIPLPNEVDYMEAKA